MDTLNHILKLLIPSHTDFLLLNLWNMWLALFMEKRPA